MEKKWVQIKSTYSHQLRSEITDSLKDLGTWDGATQALMISEITDAAVDWFSSAGKAAEPSSLYDHLNTVLDFGEHLDAEGILDRVLDSLQLDLDSNETPGDTWDSLLVESLSSTLFGRERATVDEITERVDLHEGLVVVLDTFGCPTDSSADLKDHLTKLRESDRETERLVRILYQQFSGNKNTKIMNAQDMLEQLVKEYPEGAPKTDNLPPKKVIRSPF